MIPLILSEPKVFRVNGALPTSRLDGSLSGKQRQLLMKSLLKRSAVHGFLNCFKVEKSLATFEPSMFHAWGAELTFPPQTQEAFTGLNRWQRILSHACNPGSL